MTRKPLRPLARILAARARGGDPDAVERENLRLRHEEAQERARHRAEGRILVLGMMLLAAFAIVGAKMSVMAVGTPQQAHSAAAVHDITAARADITDRNGRILARNLVTHSLYARPPMMIDRERVAAEIGAVFPDIDVERLAARFLDPDRKFVWIKRRLSPEQAQKVRDIGDPGLKLGPREMRLYPNGELAAHVLGGAAFGREAVNTAEVIGTAGIERQFEAQLRDPDRDGPLELSLDLRAQAVIREVLDGAVRMFNAKGASAVMMDANTGEVVSMVSLPDFDPNARPAGLVIGDQGDSPLFNRAVQGVYELGSTMKTFTAAQALDAGLVTPATLLDTTQPMRWGGHKLRDYRDYGNEMSVRDIIVKSSNIGTARMALEIGPEAQRDFLGRLGFLEATPIELAEGRTGRPLLPEPWSQMSAITISYGHGLSTSPLHLAAGYASLVNGGTLVRPTLQRRADPEPGERIIRPETSAIIRDMLREVVTDGTATFADVEGYNVGGKTGTADKPRVDGRGYQKGKVLSTFAGAFPMDDPEYVLVVALDEPEDRGGSEPRRTAGWTAVPVAGEIVSRVAPLLGVRPRVELAELMPEIETGDPDGITPVSN